MAEVHPWPIIDRRPEIVRQAVQHLQAGQLVAFPIDCGYGVAANVLDAAAVERLVNLPGEASPLLLAFSTPQHALDWAPATSQVGQRLARRCWPGPVVLATSDGIDRWPFARLPEATRTRLLTDGNLWLAVPTHDAITDVLYSLVAPLAVRPLPGIRTGEQLVEALGTDVALIVDDGPPPEGKNLSVVQLRGADWQMLREGTVSAAEIGRKTTCVIVFVCTGNTCRSPMAEVLCAKLLADRLNCTREELPAKGFLIVSAGVAALPGDCATREAVDVMTEMGIDLSEHVSQPLTPEVVTAADYLLTMTRGHQAAVGMRFGRHGPEPRLLDPSGDDVYDPVGAEIEVYRDCAGQIRKHLEVLLRELVPQTPSNEENAP